MILINPQVGEERGGKKTESVDDEVLGRGLN